MSRHTTSSFMALTLQYHPTGSNDINVHQVNPSAVHGSFLLCAAHLPATTLVLVPKPRKSQQRSSLVHQAEDAA